MTKAMNAELAKTLEVAAGPKPASLNLDLAAPSVVGKELALVEPESITAEEELPLELENKAVNAYEMVHRYKPDLILLDIIMPGLDGTEVAEKIRKDSALDHIPIVFLTSIITKEEAEEKVSNVPNISFLGKPILAQELISYLHQILKKSDSKAA